MGKKKELEMTSRLVKKLLTENPKTRDCDPYLYFEVVHMLNPEANNKRFGEVMLNLEELGLPCFETVRRTRAKLQADFPDLRPTPAVQDFRSHNEEVFREFMRN